MAVCVAVGFLGLLSAALGFAAEATRIENGSTDEENGPIDEGYRLVLVVLEGFCVQEEGSLMLDGVFFLTFSYVFPHSSKLKFVRQ
ncbi:hypothetical protein OPV22_034807 [Ensete ventricosum]|uniref:Uncharacterized protein n=1 Tax=Ensete ventricosum TaxID=4639 RepID=A0AAV8PKQ4_ENSVE|nr:hypothetical protein OPV22_034807 [Ensete ventricosum]